MGRATATVLFTDIVGSTELRARLGEEAADGLRRAHDRLLGQVVDENAGRVVKGLGDGIMAAFTGAGDGVAAAVAIQQAVDRLNRSGKAPAPLGVRIGLSAGDVSFEEGDVHGTPAIEAARLCALAGGGQILVSDVVQLLAGIAADDLVHRGVLDLKGLAKPVSTWEVRWEPAAVSAVPLPALLTDVGRIFVGRDAELERLEQLWKQAEAGQRQVAFLAGEPGVGKTRLAAELAIRVHERGGLVVAGRCDEDLGVPYQPFVEALRHFTDHVRPEQLAPRLGRYGGELTRLVPEVADAVPGLPAPLASDPETERYRLFDAVAVWLGAASADEPLVVVLDDLQWAAKPTLLLLRHVARSPEPRRVLILGTYRDSELSHGHPLVEVLADLRRQSDVERISITGLGSSAVAAFMEQAAGHTIGDEELALARAIHEETEGNPFFVREVLRHLNETGRFEQRDGRWSTRLPVDEIGIPESIREVIGRRLSRLSEASNGVLRTAAVVGAEFDAGVVEAAGTFDEETILSALDEAAKARLVIEQAPVGNRYRFAHALVRDTIYDELSATRRIALHRRVAEAIETVHAGAVDDHLPALAHHWARASAPAADTARAVDYAVRAGDRALAQLAHDEAASYYRQAIELLGAVENDEAEGRRVALLIALGEAERRAGDPRHRQTLLDAATAARARGDSDTLARAALANHRGTLWSVVGMVDLDRVGVLEAALDAIGDGDSPTRARLLANLALELIWAGDRPRRVRLSDEALAMARRLGDPATLAYVLANRAYAIAAPATLQERLRESAELVALSDEVGDPLLASRAWAVRFRPALEAGDTAEADRCLAAFERLASELNQPTLSWVVGLHQVGRTLLAGDIGTAERMAEDVFELGRSTGQLDATTYLGYQQTRIRYEQGRMGEVTGGIAELLARVPGIQLLWSLLALAWCQVGELDRAREAFEQVAANGFASLGFDSTWLQGMTDAAAVCAHLGDTERARVLWEVLEPYSGQVPVVAFSLATGTVDHYLGLLATTLGDFDEAESRFVAAEAVHARIGAPTWLARTRLEWARMLLIRRRPGDAERARPLLEEVLETARRLGLAAVERGAVGLRQEGG